MKRRVLFLPAIVMLLPILVNAQIPIHTINMYENGNKVVDNSLVVKQSYIDGTGQEHISYINVCWAGKCGYPPTGEKLTFYKFDHNITAADDVTLKSLLSTAKFSKETSPNELTSEGNNNYKFDISDGSVSNNKPTWMVAIMLVVLTLLVGTLSYYLFKKSRKQSLR